MQKTVETSDSRPPLLQPVRAGVEPIGVSADEEIVSFEKNKEEIKPKIKKHARKEKAPPKISASIDSAEKVAVHEVVREVAAAPVSVASVDPVPQPAPPAAEEESLPAVLPSKTPAAAPARAENVSAPTEGIAASPVTAPAPVPVPTPISASPIALTDSVPTPGPHPLPPESASVPPSPLKSVSAPPASTPQEFYERPTKTGVNFFVATGVNYVQTTENFSDVQASFHGLKGPSFNFGAEFRLSDKTWIEAYYKYTPESFDNSSIGASDTNSQWNSVTLQASTKSDALSNLTVNHLRDRAGLDHEMKTGRLISYLYGFQFHQMPFNFYDNKTNAPLIRSIDLLNASAGLSWTQYFDPWTRAVIYGRVQYPIASAALESGASFSQSPIVLFDGSVGIDKSLTNDLWLGLHWYGQYQRLNFSYSDAQTKANGVNSVFFSNAELRLSFEY